MSASWRWRMLQQWRIMIALAARTLWTFGASDYELLDFREY